jgi:hypothetical protein
MDMLTPEDKVLPDDSLRLPPLMMTSPVADWFSWISRRPPLMVVVPV